MSLENRLINALSGLQIEIYYVCGYAEDNKLKVIRDISEGEEYGIEIVNNPLIVAGTGGQGIYSVPEIGSGIICARDESSNAIISLGCMPSGFQSSAGGSRLSPPDHTPPSSIPYPEMSPDSMEIQSKSGCSVALNNDGVSITAGSSGQGTNFVLSRTGVEKTDIVDGSSTHTRAGYFRSGVVKRLSGYGLKEQTGKEKNNMGVDPLRVLREFTIGLFPKTKTADVVVQNKPKNPPRVETRIVYNQMSPDEFKGYDVYSSNYRDNSPPQMSSAEEKKQKLSHDINGICNMSPAQLIEIIAGNLINPKGQCLDSNFEPINFGESEKVPTSRPADSFKESAELEKRAIGYMFQLDTKVNSEGRSNNRDNFLYTINKEGFFTLNIPKTSDTGVVYKNNKVTFWDGLNGFEYKSDIRYGETESIPITNIYEGKVYPDLYFIEDNRRKTGVYHSDINKFSADSDLSVVSSERVHCTKYHNMPAAGEMLLANRIKDICIPTFWTNPDNGHPEGLSLMKSFEHITQSDGSLANDKAKEPRSYMTMVNCFRDNPAIDPGLSEGFIDEAPYCAQTEASISAGPHSNSFLFDSERSEDAAIFEELGAGPGIVKTGGKSANVNLEGSMEASIGKDNADGKSLVLDLAGSMVAWFGKDKNQRSAVVQADGDVVVNVGGYSGDQFNVGRFDLRVNVTNKGTLERSGPEESGELPHSSDYVISIGPHGLVIAGMTAKPMLIRNQGDLCLESSEGSVILSAFEKIKYVEAGSPERDLNSKPQERNSREAPDLG